MSLQGQADKLMQAKQFIASPSHTALSAPKPWYVSSAPAVIDIASYRRFKRLADIILASGLMILVLPVALICAIAIKLDSPGPVFFTQLRTGKHGKRFRMLKYRTMVANAEDLKEALQAKNTQSYPDFKIPDDPRITRLGHFMRKTSLDELPQLLNVLYGDMSLVGPRPTSFSATTYNLWHTARLETRPGITGLWQVSGRNNIDFDDRVRLDIAYIDNESMWLDIQILIRTFTCIIEKNGA